MSSIDLVNWLEDKTAITYDCRVGASISTSDSRASSRAAAIGKLGARGTAIRNKLDGRWVNTIVFSRPIRFANHAAPRCEVAFNK